jgi:hypothetical protein
VETDIRVWSYLAQFFLECKMFQLKFVEKVTTHFKYSNFLKKNHAYLWDNVKNIVELDRPQMAYGARALHAGYLMLKTLSEYVMHIFLLLQWLH